MSRRLGRTPPFRGPNGQIIPGSIAEVKYLCIGGVDQWVMVRGESVANPLLIILHGGPGFSDTAFFRHCNAPLEKIFTVVYWDQRGTGKSFAPTIPKSSMTVEQFLADLDELVDYACKRVGQTKVAIFGHSWGSSLGVLYAARFPFKVAAYIGSGQVGDCAAAESAAYSFALAEAERRRNRKAIEALRAIGPPPYPAKSVFTERLWSQRLTGQLSARALWKMRWIIRGTPESSIFDLRNTLRGFRFTMEAMWSKVSELNLLDLVPVLQMPVFFFIGRQDHWVPPETSVAYFDVLTAPSKTLEWFEKSGHEPFVDESAKFNAAMKELVRPVLLPIERVTDTGSRQKSSDRDAPAPWKGVIRPFDLCRASRDEVRASLPGDEYLPSPRSVITHAVTIDTPAKAVWPWLAQLGAGRAGWYSYDRIDNGGAPSARRIVAELQHIAVGDLMPAVPGTRDGFIIREIRPEEAIVLVVPVEPAGEAAETQRRMLGPLRVSWALVLESQDDGRTRLISRGRVSADWLTPQAGGPAPSAKTFIERIYGVLAKMPWGVMFPFAMAGHYVMESRMLHGIKMRAEGSNPDRLPH